MGLQKVQKNERNQITAFGIVCVPTSYTLSCSNGAHAPKLPSETGRQIAAESYPGCNKVKEEQIMAKTSRQISGDKSVICQKSFIFLFLKILLFSYFLHQPGFGDTSTALEIPILYEPNLMFSTLKFSTWKDQTFVPDHCLFLSYGFFHTKSPFQSPTSVCCQPAHFLISRPDIFLVKRANLTMPEVTIPKLSHCQRIYKHSLIKL